MDVENEISYWGHWLSDIPDGVPEAMFLLLIVASIVFGFCIASRKKQYKK